MVPRPRAKMVPRPRAKSTAKGVSRLPASAFVYPKTRQYPINTRRRARAALSRAAQPGTSGSYAKVAAAVRRRYPGMAVGNSRPTGASTRRSR
jgi:hypothetical protein